MGTASFMSAVMDLFGDDNAKYDEFFQIFHAFRKMTDANVIIRRSRVLFGDDKGMIMAFYVMLLDGKRKKMKPDDFGVAFDTLQPMTQKAENSHAGDIKLDADYCEPERKRMRGHVEANRMETSDDRSNLDITHQVEGRHSITTKISKNEDHTRAVDRDRSAEHNIDARKKFENIKRYIDKQSEKVQRDSASIPSNPAPQKRGFLSKNKTYAPIAPVSDPNLSRNQSCTPSYRFLSEEEVKEMHASQQTELGASVINYAVKSVYDGKFSPKMIGQHEQLLINYQDDMYELNTLLDSVKATVKRLEELVHEVAHAQKVEAEKAFTVSHLFCIRELHDLKGVDLYDVVRRNSTVELCEILSYLKLREDYLKAIRAAFHKTFQKVFAKNLPTSLNNRRRSMKRRRPLN